MADISDIEAAYAEYMTELKLAGPNWEKKPAAGKEGEAAWCAKEVAEHVASAGGFFGMSIAKAAGHADVPSPARPSFATADEAFAGTPAEHAKVVAAAVHVTPEQAAMETEFGPLGKTTIGAVLGVVSYHLRDHAGQLKALRG